MSVAHTTHCWWRDIARKINWLPNQISSSSSLNLTFFFGVFEFQSCPDFLVTQGPDLGLIWGCLGVIILGRNCCQKSAEQQLTYSENSEQFRQNSGLFGGCFWLLFEGCSGAEFEAETQQKQQGQGLVSLGRNWLEQKNFSGSIRVP